MENINVKNVEIINIKGDRPYLKYTILDKLNNEHILRVSSNKQLLYLVNDLHLLTFRVKRR
jgi:hypothetical protein